MGTALLTSYACRTQLGWVCITITRITGHKGTKQELFIRDKKSRDPILFLLRFQSLLFLYLWLDKAVLDSQVLVIFFLGRILLLHFPGLLHALSIIAAHLLLCCSLFLIVVLCSLSFCSLPYI